MKDDNKLLDDLINSLGEAIALSIDNEILTELLIKKIVEREDLLQHEKNILIKDLEKTL